MDTEYSTKRYQTYTTVSKTTMVFKPLRFEVVCYTAIENENSIFNGDFTCLPICIFQFSTVIVKFLGIQINSKLEKLF